MAIYLLENLASPNVHQTRRLVVQAESAADAKVMAASYFDGDGSWADATATALTATTLDTAGSMTGWVWTIKITGAAGQSVDPIEVSVTGDSDDDLDDIAGKLVTALNATEIDNAAYAAPNLTVASGSGGDDLGDAQVEVVVNPPSGNTIADLSSLLVASITDEGLASAALTVALVADTEAAPKVLATA